MMRIARDRVEDLLESADELVENLLIDELRQPPGAALVDAHANRHALALELRSRELDELVDQGPRMRAGQQHLEQRGETRANRNRGESAPQDGSEPVAKLVAVAGAQQPVERGAQVAGNAGR